MLCRFLPSAAPNRSGNRKRHGDQFDDCNFSTDCSDLNLMIGRMVRVGGAKESASPVCLYVVSGHRQKKGCSCVSKPTLSQHISKSGWLGHLS